MYLTFYRFFLALAIFSSASLPSFASHIVGGNFAYKYLGDTTISANELQKYEVSLFIYQDCGTGVPDAIAQDNPAYFTVFDNSGSIFTVDSSVYYDPTPSGEGAIEIDAQIINFPTCKMVTYSNFCLLRKKFTKIFYLPKNDMGYTVVYQRCCRNSSIVNIIDPGDNGSTFFCTIPAANTGITNNSAVFMDYPAPAICINTAPEFDHSATDADGDSLSYELCPVYNGASGPDIKPKICTPPPYSPVVYLAPYTFSNPIDASVPIQINPTTGAITVTASKVGRYIISVMCREWRNGVQINAVMREFQWTAINCENRGEDYKPDAGGDRSVIVGDKVYFKAKGAQNYHWEPATFLSDAEIANPVGIFTEPGTYTYNLHGENDMGCSGDDKITVYVYEHSYYTAPNAFTPNGDGLNDIFLPIPVGNNKFRSFSVFNRQGLRVYYTNMPGAGWDGKYKGREQDLAVFAWMVEYYDNTGEPQVASGNVTLLR